MVAFFDNHSPFTCDQSFIQWGTGKQYPVHYFQDTAKDKKNRYYQIEVYRVFFVWRGKYGIGELSYDQYEMMRKYRTFENVEVNREYWIKHMIVRMFTTMRLEYEQAGPQ